MPSSRARNTRPPPVESVPEEFGYGRWMLFLISWMTRSAAVRLLSQRSVTVERPPLQPRSLLCFSRSMVTVAQFDSAGM